jgi:predicted RNA-binding Zn ribbon-like protein
MERERGEERDLDGLQLKPAPGPLAFVQGFVNTRNIMHGYDLLEDVEGIGTWLSGRDLLDKNIRLTEEARTRLVEFREGLRGLLLVHNGGRVEGSVEVLNELAEDALLRLSFDGEGTPGLLAAGSGNASSGVIARLLAVSVGASSEGTWRRLKACRNEGCLWAFYDGSRNRSGSWCTMDVCGSRAKMRAYRQRKS